MSDSDISKVYVRFTFDNQDTSMIIRASDDGAYEVNALYRRLRVSGFPAQEVTKCDGRVYQVEVDGLVGTMRAVCEPDWFHHYVGPAELAGLVFAHGSCFESSWSVLIEYCNGARFRWEGVHDAPATLGGMYDLLVSFGMPPLRLGYESIDKAFCYTRSNDPWVRIRAYLTLFAEAQPQDLEDEPGEDFELLAREFVDDMRRYVALSRSDEPSSSALMVWSVVPDLGELEATDVQHATKSQMLALLDALTQAGEPVQIATHVLRTGMLKRWCERMEALPKEEALKRSSHYQEERARISASLDDAIRDRIAQKKVFTRVYERGDSQVPKHSDA